MADDLWIAYGHLDFSDRVRDERRVGRAGVLQEELLAELRSASIRVVGMPVGGDTDEAVGYTLMFRSLEKVAHLREEVSSCQEFRILKTESDLDECLQRDQIGIMFALEGGKPFVDRVEYVWCFWKLGVRTVQLTWLLRNDLVDGAMTGSRPGGLTRFGSTILQELHRLKILVDVSCLAEPAIRDVLEADGGPIIATHSNCKALYNSEANLSDTVLEGIASRGGVVGVSLHPGLLGNSSAPDPDAVVRNINHMLDVMGEDAVALGGSIPLRRNRRVDGIRVHDEWLLLAQQRPTEMTPELTSFRNIDAVKEALVNQGYATETLQKIFHGNWIRVYRYALGGLGN